MIVFLFFRFFVVLTIIIIIIIIIVVVVVVVVVLVVVLYFFFFPFDFLGCLLYPFSLPLLRSGVYLFEVEVVILAVNKDRQWRKSCTFN
jgi:hypothetical protein